MKLLAELLVNFLVPPLGTILSWLDVLLRRDLTLPHKGLWIVLCSLPVVGPILYLGVGRGKLW
jgi:hypothetical protein